VRGARLALGGALAMLATTAFAAPRPPVHAPAVHAPAGHVPVAPLAPLPFLPSIARVRIELLKGQVVVVEEVNLPRGEWQGTSLDFYVAFGAPGAPRAIDAQLVAVGDGALEPEESDAGEALTLDRAPRRPASAHPLLGRDTMAGVVVHVGREAFTRALAPGNMANLRVRTALDRPEEDASGARSLLVRLGASRGTPLTLGRVSIVARAGAEGASRAEVRLCGTAADPTPLAVALVPRPALGIDSGADAAVTAPASRSPIAPVLAVRHATDDLCVRFWSAP
jgi:hypothetical protein